MKKKILMFIFAFALFVPCALIMSACGGKKAESNAKEETGLSVYIDGTEVNDQFKTLEIVYGEYDSVLEMIDSKLNVIVDYSDNSTDNIYYGNDGYSISGLPQNLNANEQGYNLTLTYKNLKQSLILIIHKADIDFSNVGWSYSSDYPFIYNGDQYVVELLNIPEEVKVSYEGNTGINADTYQATAKINYDKTNYNIINSENLDLTCEWVINKKKLDMSLIKWNYIQAYTYDGQEKSVAIYEKLLPEGVEVSYEGNTGTTAGTYQATVTFNYDETNYELINNDFEKSISWVINKQQVSKPTTVGGRLFYNKQEQTGVNYNIEEEGVLFTVSGSKFETNADEYQTTFVLNDKTNYEWDDKTTNDITLTWEIEQSPISLAGIIWDYNNYEQFVYDGTEKTVSLKNIGQLPEGVTFKRYTGVQSATGAGTYTVGAEFEYDKVNYFLSNAPEDLVWTIEKAPNNITGEIVLENITYGETLGTPSGLTAANGGLITYKYYNSEHELLEAAPTNVGTYYVKGFSAGDDNWIGCESKEKKFSISTKYLYPPKLVRNSFLHTGNQFTPTLVEEIDSKLIDMTGDLFGTDAKTYYITFSLVDPDNYSWAVGTADENNDIILEWNIIESPFTFTLNDEPVSAENFESLSEFQINDKWSISVNQGYGFKLEYYYIDGETGNKQFSTTTDTGFTVSQGYVSFKFIIYQSGEEVYSKTISVNHDIFENVTVGTQSMSFDEFIANPQVQNGEKLKFNLKAEYVDMFNFSKNDFVVTEDTTITITYDEATRIYKIIEVTCIN